MNLHERLANPLCIGDRVQTKLPYLYDQFGTVVEVIDIKLGVYNVKLDRGDTILLSDFTEEFERIPHGSSTDN